MAQTPQVFRRDILERAHAEVVDDVTDDAAMAERIGVETRMFEGARSNIKVTTPDDVEMAQALLSEEFREKVDRSVYFDGFIDWSENETMSEIDVLYSKEMGIVDVALEQVFNGLYRMAPGELSKVNYAQLLLAIRAFHSLRAAALVLKRGYYSQSMGLIRMAMESHLVALDVKNNSKTLDALLDGHTDNWKGSLSFTAMANRLPGSVGENWRKRYELLSRHAHPRNPSLNILIHDDQITLHSSYIKDDDSNTLRASSYSILGELTRLIGLVETIAGESGLAHSENAFAILSDIRAVRQSIEAIEIDLEFPTPSRD